ncbi:MAG: hypothetical protein UY07_C0003G0004 [Parcubacteria group bacterium GW2011_GWA1_47_8]|nr:MAG: hypothetical protein UY07_C0003G0004 [Parcubacteria group bacterium GW2011_GWA1_47_8]
MIIEATAERSIPMKLTEAAKNKKRGVTHKLSSYFAEYDFNFREYRDKPINLLEIGVQKGGSLYMWREYLPKAKIIGADVDEKCKQFEGDGIKIYIGDQEDVDFLLDLEHKEGPFDIIIDDGGHTMGQQITTFKTLFPLLAEGGMYVIEDLHTSYWPAFGGGFTAISFLKSMIDEIHFWAKESPRAGLIKKLRSRIFPPKSMNMFQKTIRSIYIADSICFIKKETVEKNKVISF